MRFPFALLLLAGAACAEPSNATVQRCVDQCDAASDCPSGTGNCLDVCENEYAEAERISCVPEYEVILDCLGSLKNVCDELACSTQLSEYTICYGAFCGENPTNPSCVTGEGGAGQGGGP